MKNFGKKQANPDFGAKFDLDESGEIGLSDFVEFVKAYGAAA